MTAMLNQNPNARNSKWYHILVVEQIFENCMVRDQASSKEGGIRVTEMGGGSWTPSHSRPGSAANGGVGEVDPNGRPLTSDLYGTGVRPDTSGMAARVHDDEDVAERQFERGQWAQVTVYGNPQAELCQQLLDELNEAGLEYNLVDVDRDVTQLRRVAAGTSFSFCRLIWRLVCLCVCLFSLLFCCWSLA